MSSVTEKYPGLLFILTHLPPAQGEGEGLTSIPGAVHLGTVGQSEHIVTLHLLPGTGEAGPVPGLKSLDVDTHDDEKCGQRESKLHWSRAL